MVKLSLVNSSIYYFASTTSELLVVRFVHACPIMVALFSQFYIYGNDFLDFCFRLMDALVTRILLGLME